MRYLTAPIVGALLLLGCNAEFPEALDLAPADAAPADRGPSLRDMRPMDQAVDAAVDEGPPACEPEPERCDGIDNDCDNQIDEGFGIGGFCESGQGPCAVEGLRECAPDGAGAVCNAEALPGSPEVCDGVDNDCNGEVDDLPELAEGQDECLLRADLTPGCESRGSWQCEPGGRGLYCDAQPVDADGDGFGCADDCDDEDPAVNVRAVDICNFVDDDCDGEVDNGERICVCEASDRGGRRYVFCPQPLTFEGARAVCRDYGGDLAVLDARGEQAWVQVQINRIQENPAIPWLIGLADPDADGAYTWVTGEAPSWNGWAPGEPTPILEGEPAIATLSAGDWQARDDGDSRSFVCEPDCEWNDRDDDGFDQCNADCDDTARNINPDAVELCDPAGVDEDCDGEIDEGCN